MGLGRRLTAKGSDNCPSGKLDERAAALFSCAIESCRFGLGDGVRPERTPERPQPKLRLVGQCRQDHLFPGGDRATTAEVAWRKIHHALAIGAAPGGVQKLTVRDSRDPICRATRSTETVNTLIKIGFFQWVLNMAASLAVQSMWATGLT